jgi:hypothetical protein
VTAPIRTLLEGAVDYAGLFPPARLSMNDAVARYSAYLASRHAWMLGRFVVPASRLGEFAESAAGLADSTMHPWMLSALADDLARDTAAIGAINAAHAWARIDVLETRAASASDVGAIAKAVADAGVRAYVEVPLDSDPGNLIDAISAHGLGAKARTGGVVQTAIPDARQIARFLTHCIRAGVPFKATAGLHHPLRGSYRLTYEENSATAVMFGYLNVFLAAALIVGGGSEFEAIRLLEERDAGAITIEDTGVRWRGSLIAASDIAAMRRNALAGFGSCSFTEPVDEIMALGFV